MMLVNIQPRPRPRVGLTPLIDVVFILLLFFMLATRFGQPGAIELNINAGSGAARVADGAILLRVHADGAIDLNGQRHARENLQPAIEPFLKRDPDQRVIIQAADEASVKTVVELFDAMSAFGVTELSMAD